jgi:hypothetical protein
MGLVFLIAFYLGEIALWYVCPRPGSGTGRTMLSPQVMAFAERDAQAGTAARSSSIARAYLCHSSTKP